MTDACKPGPHQSDATARSCGSGSLPPTAMRFLLLLALATTVAALPAQAQPRRNAAPQHSMSVAEAAVSATVQAGGADRNAVPGSGCSGYIDNARPTAKLAVTGGGPLAIYAVSGSDTTLLVADPSGRWHCSDDANGSNPAVTFSRAEPGDYVVWVGTFSPNTPAEAELSAVRGQPTW